MKKILVWDCDGTLWPQNIIAGETPVIPKKIISIVEELNRRGVVQSIASYNLEKDVMEVLEQHHIAQFFLYPQVSLDRPKPVMLQAIKDELDISKWEDFVFVDDEVSNRAEALEAFPAITIGNPIHIDKIIEYFFTKESYTEEDRLRVRRYEQERTRKSAFKAYPGDRIEFLKNCKIKMSIQKAEEEHLPRVIDLIQRANRMSAMVEKYDERILTGLMRLGELYVTTVEDRYGDYGLSAVSIFSNGVTHSVIQALVVSCRLQGKGIGSTIVAHHANACREKSVYAIWKQTEYNTSFVDLYRFLGFGIEFSEDDSMVRAALVRGADIRKALPYPEWITL